LVSGMFKEGIGENSTFKGLHPITNLVFYGFVMVMAMFSNGPAFIGLALFMSFFYSVLLSGLKQLKTNFMFMVPIVIFMTIFNTLFNHNGATVLMYINDQRITLESVYYSIAAALLLTAVIVWFSSFNVIMSSDKLIYIFGKAAPVLGLTLSMIFRFIPLLKQRYREIHMGQKAMGRPEEKKFIPRIRQGAKEVSILISWSLEAAIETSDSMEARGYGLPHRTAFHLFKMSPTDWKVLILELIFGGISIFGLILKKTSIFYYPRMVDTTWDVMTIITFVSYTLLMVLPVIIDIKGELKWQQLKQEI